jgi:hypothetical protein
MVAMMAPWLNDDDFLDNLFHHHNPMLFLCSGIVREPPCRLVVQSLCWRHGEKNKARAAARMINS